MARRLFALEIAFVLLLIIVGAFFSSSAFAQGLPESQVSGGLQNWNISLNPKTPGPGESVTVHAVSSAFKLERTNITWYVNGVEIASGVGVVSARFTVGAVGRLVEIRAVAEVPILGTSEKILTITPAGVELLFVADTYVPPFYKGKALPTANSHNKAVAIYNIIDDDGDLVPNSDVLFTWKKGQVLNQQKSGSGRNVFYYGAQYPQNTDTIEVTASSRDGKQSKSAGINVPVRDAKLVLYEDRPLEGVRYENALVEKFTISGNEATITAEPYFFTLPSKNANKADFVWELDNRRIMPSPDRKSEITFGKPSGGSGQSYIEISVENYINYLFQKAKKEILLQF